MDATKLPLPEGLHYTKYIDDMRELAMYNAESDCILHRWDTMIRGTKFTHFEYQPVGDGVLSMADFAKHHREIAYSKFKAIERSSKAIERMTGKA